MAALCIHVHNPHLVLVAFSAVPGLQLMPYVGRTLQDHAQQHVSTSSAAGNKNPAPGEYNVSLKVTHKRALAASLQGRESHGEQQQQ
jgi:hypothetical protein